MSVRADNEIEMLEAAAESGNEAYFVTAMKSIDWQGRPPEDFSHAARLALEAGAYGAARDISALGAKRFPNEASLQEYARILAPPKVIGRRASQAPGIRANRDWLKAHADEYRGKWIILCKGVLVSAADSFDDLTRNHVTTNDLLITKVY